jgi:hypothetical protein
MSSVFWDFKEYRVETKDVPSTPHYVVMEFYPESRDDGYGGSSSIEAVRYYAFKEKQDWLMCIKMITTAKEGTREKYIYFHSSGKLTPKVTVDIEVEVNHA